MSLWGRDEQEKSSRFVGVTWLKVERKWQAQAYSNGRSIYLGSFSAEEEAARAYRDFIKNADSKGKK